MPATSKAQQRLFGMVHAYQQGKLDNASDTIKKLAAEMKPSDVKDFASTKTTDLPERVPEEIKETIKKGIQEINTKKLTSLIESIIKRVIKEARSAKQQEYMDYFRGVMDDFDIDSPADLKTDEKKKEFFNTIEKGWNG